mgnify:FL=1
MVKMSSWDEVDESGETMKLTDADLALFETTTETQNIVRVVLDSDPPEVKRERALIIDAKGLGLRIRKVSVMDGWDKFRTRIWVDDPELGWVCLNWKALDTNL